MNSIPHNNHQMDVFPLIQANKDPETSFETFFHVLFIITNCNNIW